MQTTRDQDSGARRVRISIHGRLSPSILAAFDAMDGRFQRGRTQLVGDVADQTELHGLLNRIRDLGLDLESVAISRPATSRKEPPCHP